MCLLQGRTKTALLCYICHHDRFHPSACGGGLQSCPLSVGLLVGRWSVRQWTKSAVEYRTYSLALVDVLYSTSEATLVSNSEKYDYSIIRLVLHVQCYDSFA